MSLPFIKGDEDQATRAIAFVAITGLTVALMGFNVAGAVASSSGGGVLEVVLRVFFALAISFAEIFAAIALVRVMLAPNRMRKVVGGVIFLALAWVCVQNGKHGAHLIFPDRFGESVASLKAQAEYKRKEAQRDDDRRDLVDDATPKELALVRDQIAKLEGEQVLMASQSPEKIKEAQTLLQSKGKYFGRIDGKREELTETATRARGEEIAGELANLKRREANLASGAVAPTPAISSQAAQNNHLDAIKLEERAALAAQSGLWIEVMLWVLEAARSFGMWAFVSTLTAGTLNSRRSLEDEIELARLRAELERTQAQPVAPPAPDPILAPVAPPVPPATPEPEFVPEPLNGLDKGRESQAFDRRNGDEPFRIPVGDWPHLDGRKEAA